MLTVFGLEVSPVTPKTSFPKLILVGDALGAVEAAITPAADASKNISDKLTPAIGRANDLLKRIDRLLPISCLSVNISPANSANRIQ